MAAYSRSPRRALRLFWATLSLAALAGFSSLTAMAAYTYSGYSGFSGFHGGYSGGHASYRPAPSYRPSTNNYVPQRPTTQRPTTQRPTTQRPTTQRPTTQKPVHQNKYVSPKPVPQKQVARRQPPRTHGPQSSDYQNNSTGSSDSTGSVDSTGTSSGYSSARINGTGKRVASHSTYTPYTNTATSSRRHYPPIRREGKDRTDKRSSKSSIASHDEHSYDYDSRRHHRHHHWWLYDHDYYDGDWYAAHSYYDYNEILRQRAIGNIREQIAEAEGVLDSALSSTAMLEKDRQAAQERITKARAAIDGAVAEQHESNKAMREIEARLIAGQGSDSDLAQAQAKVDAQRKAIDGEVHRVLALPPHGDSPTAADCAHEVAMLTPAQKNQLGRDSGYREATTKLRAAAQELARTQQAVFEKDPEWVAARDAATKASRAQAEADKDLGKVTGVGQLGAKMQLYAARTLADQARAVIATGRAALRYLGASVPAPRANEEPYAATSAL